MRVFDVTARIAVAAVLTSLCCTSRSRPGAERRGSPDGGAANARFVCHGDRCVQRYPRLPDDGEWTCSDTGGVAVCSGGDRPAGVPLNLSDASWICGERRTPAGLVDRERVCVNLAPDFPDGTARAWRCLLSTDDGPARVCIRDASAHVVGDACDARSPCLDGLRCVAGRCAPDPPSPSCIVDGDCHVGACRFGSCWRGPT